MAGIIKGPGRNWTANHLSRFKHPLVQLATKMDSIRAEFSMQLNEGDLKALFSRRVAAKRKLQAAPTPQNSPDSKRRRPRSPEGPPPSPPSTSPLPPLPADDVEAELASMMVYNPMFAPPIKDSPDSPDPSPRVSPRRSPAEMEQVLLEIYASDTEFQGASDEELQEPAREAIPEPADQETDTLMARLDALEAQIR